MRYKSKKRDVAAVSVIFFFLLIVATAIDTLPWYFGGMPNFISGNEQAEGTNKEFYSIYDEDCDELMRRWTLGKVSRKALEDADCAAPSRVASVGDQRYYVTDFDDETALEDILPEGEEGDSVVPKPVDPIFGSIEPSAGEGLGRVPNFAGGISAGRGFGGTSISPSDAVNMDQAFRGAFGGGFGGSNSGGGGGLPLNTIFPDTPSSGDGSNPPVFTPGGDLPDTPPDMSGQPTVTVTASNGGSGGGSGGGSNGGGSNGGGSNGGSSGGGSNGGGSVGGSNGGPTVLDTSQEITPIPEPSALGMLALGLLGLGGLWRRRR